MNKVTHFLYVPFTGLGLYGGFRGNRWLKNRIQIFKQFVVPSFLAQTKQTFIIWVSWRREERTNPLVQELYAYLNYLYPGRVVFTYFGVCFWDDKYPDEVAHERLLSALHGSLQTLVNYVGDVGTVLMTIQPSDDCYHREMVSEIQAILGSTDLQALGYERGYIMNYQTKEVKEYDPATNPPFFTIKFSKETFIDPYKHAMYTGPYKSHEYVGNKLRYGVVDNKRGFLVGTHGENISTHFNHPYGSGQVGGSILDEFGIMDVEPLKIRYSLRKQFMRLLPHDWQRKLRYLLGERFYAKFYNFIRS